MDATLAKLTRSAGIAAVAAGAIFIAVQIKHAPLDAAAVTTSEWVVRSSLKVLMGVLALIGITGMYLPQARKTGTLGLVGYLLFAANYLVIVATSFVAAYVLPSIADSSRTYVENVLVAAAGQNPTGDTGPLRGILLLDFVLYLTGGLLFGIALYRARVLPRWAAVLLAVGGAASAALSLLPDPWFRLLAVPNGIAMIGLGYALWRSTGTETTQTPTETTQATTGTLQAPPTSPRVAPVGVE